jgi:O-antigen/teichoic acid export membrane protein
MTLISRLSERAQAWLWGHDDRPNTLRRLLIKATGGTLLLRITWQGLSFLTSIMLAHLLDLDGYGIYTYVMSWVLVLLIPNLFGLDRLLVRELATYRAKENWAAMKGLLTFIHVTALLLWLLSAALLVAASWLVLSPGSPVAASSPDDEHNRLLLYALWMSALLMAVNTLIALYGSTMQGLHHIVRGQVPDLFVRPILFVGLVGVAAISVSSGPSVTLVMALRIVASIIALGYSIVLLLRILPAQLRQARPHYGDLRMWIRTIPPLFYIGVAGVILARADFLLLAPLRRTGDVALYGTAYILAQFVSMILMVAIQPLAPTFAQIYASGDLQRLQRVTVKSARSIMLASTPVAIVLILLGKQALQIYGAEYSHAYPALVILVVGHFVNVVTGTPGVLLLMTGHEREVAVGRTVGAVVNVVLNLLLIPAWGTEGAATANTISIVIWNGMLIVFARRRLGIKTTALGF